MDAVSSVLADRMRQPGGLGRMLGYSLGLHTVAALALLLASVLRPSIGADLPKTIMTVSLSGGPGPRAGGVNPLGGRPVQTTARPPEPKRPEPLRPPAARTPAMTVPAPASRPASKPAEPAPAVKFAPDEARGRTPARGDQEQFGSAIAETGAQGFGGLSTGGGSGTRGVLDDISGPFCCPEYLGVMQQRIQANWNSRQEVAGSTMMKFRILRDGSIVDLEVERPSGFYALDYAAQRALVATRKLPPLPTAFPDSALTVHLMFDYVR
jgi:TonB family protein